MRVTLSKCLGMFFAFLMTDHLPMSYPPSLLTGTHILISNTPTNSTNTDGDTGNQTSRGGLDGSCEDVDIPLTAIRPLYRRDRLTQQMSPTLTFYIPYTREKITRAEFLLLPQDESRYIYETPLQLPDTPGIVTITFDLPSDLNSNRIAEEYRWYLNLVCESAAGKTVNLSVNGWIQYTSEDEPAYYDLIASTVVQLNSENDVQTDDWLEVLEMVDSLEKPSNSTTNLEAIKLSHPSIVNAPLSGQLAVP